MMKIKSALSFATLGLALSLAATGARADLITNGNFTTNGGGGQIGYNTTANGWTMANSTSYTFLFTSPTQATSGVTGQSGNLALWGPGDGSNNGLTASPAGGSFIASDGAYEQSAIQQTIAGLTVGQSYAVSFYYAGAQQYTFHGANTEQWEVSLGGQNLYTSVLDNTDEGFTGWQYTTMVFTATSASEVLSFLAIGTPSGVPPFSLLDGVTMNAVPEPTSAAMMLSGLAGLIGFGWWRRRNSTAA